MKIHEITSSYSIQEPTSSNSSEYTTEMVDTVKEQMDKSNLNEDGNDGMEPDELWKILGI